MDKKLPSTMAASKQVHRQRMGAIMGPTILFKCFLAEECTRAARLQKLRRFITSCEKAASKVKPSKAGFPQHLETYQDFCKTFCAGLDLKTENGYVHKHIFRKHVLSEVFFKSGCNNSSAATVEAGLSALCSRQFLPKDMSRSTLVQLLPDQGGYLSAVPSCLKPWDISRKLHNVDPLLISAWACLCHDLIQNAQKWVPPLDVAAIIQFVKANAEVVLANVRAHKKQHIDGKVPVAECIHNILKPLLCSSGSCSSPAKVKAATMPPTEDSPSQKRPRRLKWGNHVLAVEEGSGDADSAEVQAASAKEQRKDDS